MYNMTFIGLEESQSLETFTSDVSETVGDFSLLSFNFALELPWLSVTVGKVLCPGLILVDTLGLLSVVETVRLDLCPAAGLGDGIFTVVILGAGSTMIPDRLARILATSCLSAGVRDLPLPGDTAGTMSLPWPIRITSFSGLVAVLLGLGMETCSPPVLAPLGSCLFACGLSWPCCWASIICLGPTCLA